MKPGELLRVRVAFGALGVVPVFLAGWLGWLQVAQAGTIERRDGSALPLIARTADRQGWKVEAIPAPRGAIVDRFGGSIDRGPNIRLKLLKVLSRCNRRKDPRQGHRL